MLHKMNKIPRIAWSCFDLACDERCAGKSIGLLARIRRIWLKLSKIKIPIQCLRSNSSLCTDWRSWPLVENIWNWNPPVHKFSSCSRYFATAHICVRLLSSRVTSSERQAKAKVKRRRASGEPPKNSSKLSLFLSNVSHIISLIIFYNKVVRCRLPTIFSVLNRLSKCFLFNSIFCRIFQCFCGKGAKLVLIYRKDHYAYNSRT